MHLTSQTYPSVGLSISLSGEVVGFSDLFIHLVLTCYAEKHKDYIASVNARLKWYRLLFHGTKAFPVRPKVPAEVKRMLAKVKRQIK